MAPSAKVLVVDDDPLIRTLVARLLEADGYEVREVGDAIAAAQLLGSDAPDLVVLDVGLPGIDGLELLEGIRRTNDVPVILLTGRSSEDDRVRGLRQGADDYVVKPFLHGELMARVESVLRRARVPQPAGGPVEQHEVLAFDDLRIDPAAREVFVGDRVVDLTAREFVLLEFLARSPRQVFSREQLLQHVWNSSSDWQDPATVTEHVRRVRQKIEPNAEAPRWLRTVRGMGYRFEP
jgi:two-component system phosphate regulon response regulator PhoB